MTVRDLCTDALRTQNICGAVDTPPAEDLSFVVNKLNLILDDWNATPNAVYAEQFNDYVLTPGLNPHTLGPTGATFTVAIRPVKVLKARLVLTDASPAVYVPIRVVSASEYGDLSVRAITSSIPSVLYCEEDWPNASLYLWPVPTTAYSLELWTWQVLSSVTLATTFSLPPGYWSALLNTLMETIAPAFPNAAPPQGLPMAAAKSRARIFSLNQVNPKLATQDAGIPGRGPGGGRADFNWRTGEVA